jgi:hypothetical protein
METVRCATPLRDLKYIQSCLILHNIAVKHNDFVDPYPDGVHSRFQIRKRSTYAATKQGKALREHIISEYFSS